MKKASGEKAGMRELSGYFRALSDVTRIKILHLLTDHEMCVCELKDRLAISQPAVSHHLGVLRKAGLISSRKSGKWTYYSINGKKIMENHDKFKELALHAIEERATKGMPASPVQKDGDSYCKTREKLSAKNLNEENIISNTQRPPAKAGGFVID